MIYCNLSKGVAKGVATRNTRLAEKELISNEDEQMAKKSKDTKKPKNGNISSQMNA